MTPLSVCLIITETLRDTRTWGYFLQPFQVCQVICKLMTTTFVNRWLLWATLRYKCSGLRPKKSLHSKKTKSASLGKSSVPLLQTIPEPHEIRNNLRWTALSLPWKGQPVSSSHNNLLQFSFQTMLKLHNSKVNKLLQENEFYHILSCYMCQASNTSALSFCVLEHVSGPWLRLLGAAEMPVLLTATKQLERFQ